LLLRATRMLRGRVSPSRPAARSAPVLADSSRSTTWSARGRRRPRRSRPDRVSSRCGRRADPRGPRAPGPTAEPAGSPVHGPRRRPGSAAISDGAVEVTACTPRSELPAASATARSALIERPTTGVQRSRLTRDRTGGFGRGPPRQRGVHGRTGLVQRRRLQPGQRGARLAQVLGSQVGLASTERRHDPEQQDHQGRCCQGAAAPGTSGPAGTRPAGRWSGAQAVVAPRRRPATVRAVPAASAAAPARPRTRTSSPVKGRLATAPRPLLTEPPEVLPPDVPPPALPPPTVPPVPVR
jgi:hypothetical protein